MNIGKSIKKALIDKDMSQADLAKMLDISRQSMSQVCAREYCTHMMLQNICDALHMKASELIALGE